MVYALKNQSIFRVTSRPSSPSTSPSKVPFNRKPSSLTSVTPPSHVPLIQDGSYLEALSLRLNEAVSKALAHPSGPAQPSELVAGRRPIPPGRGHTFGKLIASELQAAHDKKHLYKAVLRAVQRPMSVLLNNLSALLLPLLSSSAFLQPPAPTLHSPTSNPTQLHALAIADFAGELLSSFDENALGIDTDSRGDGLQAIRAGLVSLIGRVIAPLITGIKEALFPLLDALELPARMTPQKAKGSVHPSITALQSCVPLYTQALVRYSSTYKSDTLLASFLISIMWRALVALSHRSVVSQTSTSVALSEKGQYSPSLGASSPIGFFGLKCRSSRPGSPFTSSAAVADGKALYEIFSYFPRPTHAQVAREAVEEAFVHLEALVSLLEIADDPFFVVNKTAEEVADEIYELTDELPTLIALPVLLRVQHFGILGPQVNTVATLLNLQEDVYRKDCLVGFGRAEQCGPIVVQQILDGIYAQTAVDCPNYLVGWLETRLGQSDR